MQQSPSKHDEFEKAREKFKQGVQARNRTRYEKLQDANTATAIAAAVDLAYNDAKRTLAGIGKYPDKKDNALKCIIEKLEDYFHEEKAPSAEEEFDGTEWHDSEDTGAYYFLGCTSADTVL